MSDYLLAPSILSADFSRLGEQMREAEAAGADWFHLDVMDGCFVPNITLGPPVVRACRRVTERPLDVHLMICEPERYLRAFAEAGADLLTVHLEACPHLHRTLQTIRELGCRAGVAINPATPVSLLSEILDLTDLILVMSVNPGFGGQTFIPRALHKIEQARRLIGERPIRLEVDGGLNAETLPRVKAAGADVFVAGSAVFGHPQGPAAGVKTLRGQL